VAHGVERHIVNYLEEVDAVSGNSAIVCLMDGVALND
jgi:hypothetical protein